MKLVDYVIQTSQQYKMIHDAAIPGNMLLVSVEQVIVGLWITTVVFRAGGIVGFAKFKGASGCGYFCAMILATPHL